ncbi:DUF262 domain-containing protein [Haloarcula nitratireducens]|uniref:DUF262 domain-containing protein n=1 Tax=Haloarcula nitratireducens TaxID=2487749 RepID=A0AAW4PJZ1_9EURY|nr:DUF262 domain-containing protein [Halomicroarcula nitratireducens]MBX0297537.1 DUF262 domain-containing protein [Halomicroarcula nitratireducens]
MSETNTVAETLPQLNESLFIPCLQRDYCWSQKQVEMLWDSLLRGLPLGSLLVWDRNIENREDPAYQFIRHYVDERGYSHEKEVRRYSKRLPNFPESYSLILDGQQRLTSFYIGLYGSYTTRIHGAWKQNESSYNRRHLYLDLFSGDDSDSHDRGLVHEFDFRKSGGLNSAGDSYWLRVGTLLDDTQELTEAAFLDQEQFIAKVKEELPTSLSDVERSNAIDSAEQLWRGVNEREAILYQTTLTDEKTARELFIRRNKGGIELSGVDILLALLTGYWETVEDVGAPKDAKNEIEEFTERLSGDERLSEEGFTFGKRFTLRTLLLLSGETPSFRKDGRYDGDLLSKAEEIFRDDEFEQAVRDAFELAADLGFHNAALSSKTVVTPVVQFLYETDYDTTGDNEEIHYWLATAVLNGIFGDIGSQRVLETAREHIQESDGHKFPAGAILADLSGRGTTTHLDEEVLDTLLDEVNYQSGSRRNVLLTHLYGSDRRAGHTAYEVDHIFPRGKLANREYLEEQGVAPEAVDWYKEHRDHIANLQLLNGDGANQSKGDRDFSEWLERVEEGEVGSLATKKEYFETHWIPENEAQHEYPQFEQFLMAESGRKQSIREQLRQTLPLRNSV